MAAAEDMGIAIMDEHIDQLMPVYTNFAAQLFSNRCPDADTFTRVLIANLLLLCVSRQELQTIERGQC